MTEDLFDKIIREKLYGFSITEETGDWEALATRMSHRAVLRRRRRIIFLGTAAAACLLLLLVLFMPYQTRTIPEQVTICRIADCPAAIKMNDYPQHIAELYTQARLDILRTASVIPLTSEVTGVRTETPPPAMTEPEPFMHELKEKAIHGDVPVQEPAEKKDQTRSSVFPVDPPEKIRLNKKWITAANFSYQGAINGTYLFTPSTYTTKWETPLSLASSDLSNLGVPDYMKPNFDEDDVNHISAHFSTPISAGINVQKEFNKWLSVGASLTYTLLRGEYQVHTADKSYIVNQNTHYIGIPVSIYFRAVNTPHLTVYAVGGGAIDRAVADEYICQLNDVATRQYVPVKGFQWSLFGGLGIEYKWSELMGIYIEPTVSHYFDNNQPKSIRTIQPTQFKMELGIRFRI
ncbi:MAG: hypothetical protein BWX62_00315 [Bacteroidetes bacterium ADurb.Bin037]|nr:MAG: hypothetical protein BWX62_00315 [Bacteroidetes bacterium ADurb.Bin037]HPW78542.1 outer membrane beta-barrel protein [Bacteroidales bacterium]HQB55753.1 outer membrane beta-barrel protein [Bacteroidales bacterium]